MNLIKTIQLTILGVCPLLAQTLFAGSDPTTPDPLPLPDTISSSIFKIEPTMHLRIAAGNTTTEEGHGEFGGHDPRNDGFNLQGFEIGSNIHIGDYLSGFATVNVFKPKGEDFDAELEEAFLKLHDLPYGFELRGGRMKARYGDQNAKHLHSWDFADSNMSNVRFLGEDGLGYEGGELTWLTPTPIEDALSIGFGSAVAHDHNHGGGDEEDHDHDHRHGAELAYPEKNIIVARYQATFGPDDFHQFQAGGSFLTGENGFQKNTDIYGADITYTWRENGLEPGGKQFRWRNEWMIRDVETHHGTFTENGFNTALLWEFIETWEAGIRYGYVEGVDHLELSERHRISPTLTKHFNLADNLFAIIRLQYNHDELQGHGTEDSLWLQFGFDWGPGEVR